MFEWPVLGMQKAQLGQVQPVNCAKGVVEPALGALAGLGRLFVGGAVLLNEGVFQMFRRYLATTAHRALPVHYRPALGMPWATTHRALPVCE